MLGSGSSVGSPVVGRDYENVQEKNWRTRSSVYISIDNKRYKNPTIYTLFINNIILLFHFEGSKKNAVY